MGVANPPIINVDQQVHFCLSKINDGLVLRGGFVIQDNLIGACLG